MVAGKIQLVIIIAIDRLDSELIYIYDENLHTEKKLLIFFLAKHVERTPF